MFHKKFHREVVFSYKLRYQISDGEGIEWVMVAGRWKKEKGRSKKWEDRSKRKMVEIIYDCPKVIDSPLAETL